MNTIETMPMALGRVHARRLRELYRSAGWPSQDKVEVELLAAGLLERVTEVSGHDKVRLTDAGINYLALAFHKNRQARSAHETLVDLVAQTMMRDGRIVWTGLSLRAQLPSEPETSTRWKICMPDVFSIRNTTVAGYLEPVVHEIKVSRADLLGDLKSKDKRDSYLNVGGQCWYVLGCDGKGRPIAKPEEIPDECGVMLLEVERLEVIRNAPKRAIPDLPFSMWMALAKSTPLGSGAAISSMEPSQSLLTDQPDPGQMP
ncbi:MAG: hypothetical protein KJ852_16575 [Gammaproteobacteria bacterium]|nr:hypothetical protein [Gammaproteobacteria bacterium]MBU0786838.1 hypothetical protein [Gammaproteobacteria bacterium]MBU0813956.1 hypothetical protein [Gammaproteobacteria bacterium]MBU1788571.1 hypothetical protein [Gammaproteobacteria bacterium]